VAFPLGNAECSDIMVRSPTGKYFTIEIKSFLAKTFIRFKKKDDVNDLFYIFVDVGQPDEPTAFYILTGEEAQLEHKAHIESRRPEQQYDHYASGWGAYYTKIRAYGTNRWDKLPM
jgi:hypothetical protein